MSEKGEAIRSGVMPGLVPGIQPDAAATWMAGTSPAMT
jgi:hypothetical protein